jgi:hypothetical protein
MNARRAPIGVVGIILAASAICLARGAEDISYKAAVEKWRQNYEASLKSDHGWLTVSGLFWLDEGENKFGSDPLNDIVLPESSAPSEAGYFEFHDGKTVVHVKPGVPVTQNGKPVETAEIPPDSPAQAVVLGDLTFGVHRSGGRYAIRLQDKNSKLRKDFSGLHWFPIDEAYRVTGRYVPYDKPRQVPIQNIMGDALQLSIPGYVAFSLGGQDLRLDAEADDSGLFIIFRDLTSGKETYGAARFLAAAAPKNGEVVLDFNEAYNPPCAYNPYTTCPLPPPQNRLRVRIEAGEMIYKRDHGT